MAMQECIFKYSISIYKMKAKIIQKMPIYVNARWSKDYWQTTKAYGQVRNIATFEWESILWNNPELAQAFECKELHCGQHANEKNNLNLYKI